MCNLKLLSNSNFNYHSVGGPIGPPGHFLCMDNHRSSTIGSLFPDVSLYTPVGQLNHQIPVSNLALVPFHTTPLARLQQASIVPHFRGAAHSIFNTIKKRIKYFRRQIENNRSK